MARTDKSRFVGFGEKQLDFFRSNFLHKTYGAAFVERVIPQVERLAGETLDQLVRKPSAPNARKALKNKFVKGRQVLNAAVALLQDPLAGFAEDDPILLQEIFKQRNTRRQQVAARILEEVAILEELQQCLERPGPESQQERWSFFFAFVASIFEREKVPCSEAKDGPFIGIIIQLLGQLGENSGSSDRIASLALLEKRRLDEIFHGVSKPGTIELWSRDMVKRYERPQDLP